MIMLLSTVLGSNQQLHCYLEQTLVNKLLKSKLLYLVIGRINLLVYRLPEATLDEKIKYISKWVTSHIEDGERELNKPVLFTEFGLSKKNKNFDYSHRELFYKSVFDIVYESAKQNGAGAGALIWQLLVEGMEDYNDDFGFVPGERTSVDKLIKQQSCRLAALRHGDDPTRRAAKKIC